MAGNEGTSQTELWSSVVHQPCEEPEDAELPSTVDLAAFSATLAESAPAGGSGSESDSEPDSSVTSSELGMGRYSEASASSQSDSTDSDSSTSTPESVSRSPSPEFSVTSVETDHLRLTIAQVRKAASPPPPAAARASSSSASSASESESDAGGRRARRAAPAKAEKRGEGRRAPQRKEGKGGPTNRAKTRPKRTKKMAASLPLSRGSTYNTSSDSDESDSEILASCSLQEIPQEDLAAILPDQQDCDAFADDFECAPAPKPAPAPPPADSGSDMELPQQAVNALIQRTGESSSESESPPAATYANSLLQHFVQQQQLLACAPAPPPPPPEAKRKRGRPRKSAPPPVEYADPNVSPDSGIQNSPERAASSPEPPPARGRRADRPLYANADRVLYPPRRKAGRPPAARKGPGRPPKASTRLSICAPSLASAEKTKTRPVLATKNNKLEPRGAAPSLKNLKLMHSRHKHKKHKKYKFKLLKPPPVCDGRVVQEIEKLTLDFYKLCVIGALNAGASTKQTKENLPESSKPIKKLSKKRKTSDHAERKKKKVVTNVDKEANLNEQRLPLKKRHYLFSDGKSTAKEDVQILEEEECSKETKPLITPKESPTTTPKKRLRVELDNDKKTAELFDANKPAKQTLETLITELKAKKAAPKEIGREKEPLLPVVAVQLTKLEDQPKPVAEAPKKRVRKRRAINRTGFPTIKKKKKKVVQPVEAKSAPKPVKVECARQVGEQTNCDRVPKSGEECDKFIERTSDAAEADEARWEVTSECDSLPLDERVTDAERGESGEEGEETSLEASIERLRSRLDRKKRKRCSNSSEKAVEASKRRLRDVSPASSIEPVAERRLREERASASGDEAKKSKRAPRWRKRHLVAGLFSDYYKEDDETKRSEVAAKTRLIYNPEEHPYGLLPPPYHCGKYLRCRKLPFQLPYDLWWQHTHSQLPGRDVVPSWNYRKIRTNVYNVKTTTGACEPQNCNCTSSANCGDDCINRLVLAECPASHKCHNQRIQRHEWSPGIDKFMTEFKGWGVRTKLPIKSSEFILEYVGEVVSDQEFKERMATIYTNDTHHYCLHLDGGLVIDGHRMGGDGRFVNHSCAPNCEIQKWSVNGQFRMALFSLRAIAAGEELTYDYNFSLFNPAEGQACRCGSERCRGVIGGKSQRVRQLPAEAREPGRVGRPRKNRARRAASGPKEAAAPAAAPARPMSHQQKCFIAEHHCFLLRNLARVRRVRVAGAGAAGARQQTATPTNQTAATFINHLNALDKPRNIKTRRLAQAEDDAELNKTVKLAAVLREIWIVLTRAKSDNGEELLSTPFITMPSKRKLPEFYQRITDPIDLTTIEQNIATGIYLTPESFDADMNRLFSNFLRFYGRTNEIGVAAIKLKKIYSETKQQNLNKFEDVLGKKPPPAFISNKNKNEEEDIIRCICGLPNDEGLMIQCERCMVWQHNECVKADVSAESYHCEQCAPRKVDYEIPMDEFTEHGHRYYVTVMRGELQLRQGDTVYVLRDIPIAGTDRKHTYDTIGGVEYTDLDIFRIERLWKDSKTGQRFAYGHHYLRPHETYHEPTRKFFPNEVMRVPLYEAVPVELIIRHCWVMDLNTFCKGRPIGAPEEHIYICEYRVDKSARLFSKVSKSKYPICTKSFIFERFENRMRVSRTYTPHDLDPAMLKPRGRKPQDDDLPIQQQALLGNLTVPVPIVRTPMEQKTRLNKILLNLLSKMPTKQALDVSYLLEGGRRRKKPDNVAVKS